MNFLSIFVLIPLLMLAGLWAARKPDLAYGSFFSKIHC